MYTDKITINCIYIHVCASIFQLPSVTEEQVKSYLKLFDQQLRDNSVDMYRGKFLRSIRFSADTDFTFVCGRVSAEYSKQLVYKVDIKLNRHGVVDECQCQCAAGMGPDAHCKHAAVVYYAMTKVKEGIVTKETCTQQLQTFHQAKKYTGSPVKMQDRSVRTKSGNSLAALKDFDPRPVELRKTPGYSDHFRSVWLNSSTPGLSIRQLYGPANVYGITNDHDYLEKRPDELFLESMCVTAITEGARVDIEARTRGQSKSKSWKEERLIRLQSSSFGRICKATQRTDFEKLTKSLTDHKDISSDAIKHGKKHEAIARIAYIDLVKESVIESGIIVCAEAPFLGCSPDGLVGDEGLLEIKCPYTARDKDVHPETVPYLKNNTDGCLQLDTNHDYYYQIMGALLCTDRTWCDFVVWTFKGLKMVRIQRDEEFISNMKAHLTEFFNNHFKATLLKKHFYKNSHLFLSVKERM